MMYKLKYRSHLLGMNTLLGLMIVLLASLMSSSTWAAIVSINTGNGADAYIVSTSSNTNFGGAEFVAIKHDSGTGQLHRKGYFRFDLTGITAVADATLNLIYVGQDGPSAVPSTYNVHGLLDGDPGESWDELGITWNNAPSNLTGSGDGFDSSNSIFLGQFTLDISTTSLGDTIQFSAPNLTSFLQGDTNGLVTFMVSRVEQNLANEYFGSKENLSFAPSFLDVTPVPVPASVLLFGSGLLGLIGFARRKTHP